MFLDVRLVENPSRQSPMPAIRNRSIIHEETTNITRSPMPTPRNLEDRVTQGNYRNISSITVHASPRENRRAVTEISRPIATVQRTSSNRLRADESPTAKLIHKLFRNRDPSFLPGPSPLIQPLMPHSSTSTSSTRNQRDVENNPNLIDDNQISTTTNAPHISDDNDTDSEYLSVENLSLNNLRSDTPPPAYKSIFIEEN